VHFKTCFIQAKEGDIKKQYEFKRKLGSGGFSSVFLARNKESNDMVAIKSLDKKTIKSEDY
jgi:serine/threonine protein kinase